ncbi:uncharacterized protein LOC119682192 [Teleopsis dalmanni]|uniref:uncharacterized protein LOC119682192 n=1 Tax=Teleopsis dalmanni TaxID=139649 RepID=UPI0018CFC532|nr:uncharacterized protein LOC119682192 [Teleopsis dalmanni]
MEASKKFLLLLVVSATIVSVASVGHITIIDHDDEVITSTKSKATPHSVHSPKTVTVKHNPVVPNPVIKTQVKRSNFNEDVVLGYLRQNTFEINELQRMAYLQNRRIFILSRIIRALLINAMQKTSEEQPPPLRRPRMQLFMY